MASLDSSARTVPSGGETGSFGPMTVDGVKPGGIAVGPEWKMTNDEWASIRRPTRRADEKWLPRLPFHFLRDSGLVNSGTVHYHVNSPFATPLFLNR